MKKILLCTFLIALLFDANAQWYNKKYGVSSINDLTREQLMLELKKANSMLITGKIMMVTGGVTAGVGGIVALAGLVGIIGGAISNSDESIDRSDNVMKTGFKIGIIGSVIFWTGLPIKITGKSRKNSIELALLKFKPVTFSGTIPLVASGVGITINF
jgi:hypothetical protein